MTHLHRSLALSLALGVSVLASHADEPQAPQFMDADRNDDGVVTRQEFVEHRSARFRDFGDDESGALTREEFAGALEGTPMHRFSGRAFKRADADGSDEVSLDEWDDLPTRAFDRLDKNDDGQVDSSEAMR